MKNNKFPQTGYLIEGTEIKLLELSEPIKSEEWAKYDSPTGQVWVNASFIGHKLWPTPEEAKKALLTQLEKRVDELKKELKVFPQRAWFLGSYPAPTPFQVNLRVDYCNGTASYEHEDMCTDTFKTEDIGKALFYSKEECQAAIYAGKTEQP